MLVLDVFVGDLVFSDPSKVMKKLTMEPPERLTALQALWDDQAVDTGPCGVCVCVCVCVCVFQNKTLEHDVYVTCFKAVVCECAFV